MTDTSWLFVVPSVAWTWLTDSSGGILAAILILVGAVGLSTVGHALAETRRRSRP